MRMNWARRGPVDKDELFSGGDGKVGGEEEGRGLV